MRASHHRGDRKKAGPKSKPKRHSCSSLSPRRQRAHQIFFHGGSTKRARWTAQEIVHRYACRICHAEKSKRVENGSVAIDPSIKRRGMTNTEVPQWAIKLLQSICPDHLAEEIEGDLMAGKYCRQRKCLKQRAAMQCLLLNNVSVTQYHAILYLRNQV